MHEKLTSRADLIHEQVTALRMGVHTPRLDHDRWMSVIDQLRLLNQELSDAIIQMHYYWLAVGLIDAEVSYLLAPLVAVRARVKTTRLALLPQKQEGPEAPIVLPGELEHLRVKYLKEMNARCRAMPLYSRSGDTPRTLTGARRWLEQATAARLDLSHFLSQMKLIYFSLGGSKSRWRQLRGKQLAVSSPSYAQRRNTCEQSSENARNTQRVRPDAALVVKLREPDHLPSFFM